MEETEVCENSTKRSVYVIHRRNDNPFYTSGYVSSGHENILFLKALSQN